MFAVFNRAISRRSSCTLWRNSSIVVATVRFYTRGVRAVHKTEHLSAAFGSVAPKTPKRYFCVREHITPTNVIFDLCPLAAARLSEPPAEHKTQVSQDTDKRYFGCQTFGRTNLKVVLKRIK